MAKSNVNFCTAYYANAFKAWQVKVLGAKPTEAMMQAVHYLGAELGKQHLTIAMALRDGGVTSAQILSAAALLDVNGQGKPQNNKRNGFIDDGLLREIVMPPMGKLKTYACEVTPKGQKRIDTRLKAAEALFDKGEAVEPAVKPVKADAPTKVKHEPKPRKRPNKPADTVKVIEATEVAQAPENAPAVTVSPAIAVLNETVDYPQGDKTFE